MQKKVRDAMKAYRTAMKLDETSVPALTGNIFLLKLVKCAMVKIFS